MTACNLTTSHRGSEVFTSKADYSLHLLTSLPRPEAVTQKIVERIVKKEHTQLKERETKAITKAEFVDTGDQTSKYRLTSESETSPTNRLLSYLDNLFKTPEDMRWPEATWPTKQAFDDARVFITKLPLGDIPEPLIRFAADGEINFLWTDEEVDVDLGFYGTGTYSYFGCDGSGQKIKNESVLASEGMAQEIKDLLAA